jgi:transcriptional regulator with XRE-family HTH domain
MAQLPWLKNSIIFRQCEILNNGKGRYFANLASRTASIMICCVVCVVLPSFWIQNQGYSMLTETDVTGTIARRLRESAGLTQTVFWERLGVTQSVGCRYEMDVNMPRSVRILLVATYISGVTINTGTHDGVAELARLGEIQSGRAKAKSVAKDVGADLARASKSLKDAQDALKSI